MSNRPLHASMHGGTTGAIGQAVAGTSQRSPWRDAGVERFVQQRWERGALFRIALKTPRFFWKSPMEGCPWQVARAEVDVPFATATFMVYEVEDGPQFLAVRFSCHGKLIWTNVRRYRRYDRGQFQWAWIIGHLVVTDAPDTAAVLDTAAGVQSNPNFESPMLMAFERGIGSVQGALMSNRTLHTSMHGGTTGAIGQAVAGTPKRCPWRGAGVERFVQHRWERGALFRIALKTPRFFWKSPMEGWPWQVPRAEVDVPFATATFMVYEVEDGPQFLSVRFSCHGKLIWTNVWRYRRYDRDQFHWAWIIGHLVV